MTRHKYLFILVGLLSLIGIGAGAVAKTALSTGAAPELNCCDDPTCPPGCCSECPLDCCPSAQQIEAQTFTCPLTGEQLPCANCCPLNPESAQEPAKIACPSCPLCP